MENSSITKKRKTMEKYECIEKIGKGSFGQVFKAIDKSTGETVAVKKIETNLRKYSWHAIHTLNEVDSLKKMVHYPNIVNLKDVIHEENKDDDRKDDVIPGEENKDEKKDEKGGLLLYLILEFMESNLEQLIMRQKRRRPNNNLSESEIKRLCFQLLSGLIYMHQQAGYFHRDLKPENILVTQGTLKIADFGLAKGILEPNPSKPETVGTLWYRAPEMLFYARDCDSKVDMWALGVIMAEMYTGRRLLPGRDEPDQMNLICKFIGSPNPETWPEGFIHADRCNYEFPLEKVGDLSERIPNASPDALSLIKSLCSWNPRDRPSAIEAIQHRFFDDSSSGMARLSSGLPPGPKQSMAMVDSNNMQRTMFACH